MVALAIIFIVISLLEVVVIIFLVDKRANAFAKKLFKKEDNKKEENIDDTEFNVDTIIFYDEKTNEYRTIKLDSDHRYVVREINDILNENKKGYVRENNSLNIQEENKENNNIDVATLKSLEELYQSLLNSSNSKETHAEENLDEENLDDETFGVATIEDESLTEEETIDEEEKVVFDEDSGQYKSVKLIRSFEGRLSISSDELKNHYNEIKNKLLSYNLKTRISKSVEKFNFKRDNYAQIKIVGKTLVLYLSLDINNLDAKYQGIDVGNIKTYKSTPFKYKITSNKRFELSLELIDILAKEKKLELINEYKNKNFIKDYPYMDDDTQIEKGYLVKKETIINNKEDENKALDNLDNNLDVEENKALEILNEEELDVKEENIEEDENETIEKEEITSDIEDENKALDNLENNLDVEENEALEILNEEELDVKEEDNKEDIKEVKSENNDAEILPLDKDIANELLVINESRFTSELIERQIFDLSNLGIKRAQETKAKLDDKALVCSLVITSNKHLYYIDSSDVDANVGDVVKFINKYGSSQSASIVIPNQKIKLPKNEEICTFTKVIYKIK